MPRDSSDTDAPSDRVKQMRAPILGLFGGKNATVIYALATPGFAGLNQIALQVPTGVPAGNAALQLSVGGASSNSVNIAVK